MVYNESYRIKKKSLSYQDAKLKAADFCAYQERSQQEVRDKLYTYGLHKDEVEKLLSELITKNFVNEERFAIAYAGGKYRMKSWGKNKILQGLRQHKISQYCINKALREIDDKDYNESIKRLIEQKKASIRNIGGFQSKQKIARYLMQKGYEQQLVWDHLKTFDEL